jgi:hypothetical protein
MLQFERARRAAALQERRAGATEFLVVGGVRTVLDIVSQDLAPALAQAMGQIENAFRRLTNFVRAMDQEALDYLHGVTGQPKSAELEAHYGRVIDILAPGRPLHAAPGPDRPAEGLLPGASR